MANNGEPALTHALLAGIPAIAAGTPEKICTGPDQIGAARTSGICDIGVYAIDGNGFFVIPLSGNRAVVVPE